jgi:RNA polymerase sigma-70 factor, ECF subfamily
MPPANAAVAFERDEARERRLAAMLQAHFKSVWRTLLRLGVVAQAADDQAQEVFIIAARKLEQIELGKEREFLIGTAARVAANVRRAQRARPWHADDAAVAAEPAREPDAEALLEQKRRRELLDQVLDAMPFDLRSAFVLFELEGMSGPEVAETLEVPLGTAASRLRRARALFHEECQRVRQARRGAER